MVDEFVTVVVEGAGRDDFLLPLRMRAPANMTVSQFVDKIRGRLPQGHLVLKKGSTVAMSQNMSCVYRENKSENGLLHFTWATESTFGCPPPPEKPITKMFPGEEAMPFGAPEPNLPPLPEGSEDEPSEPEEAADAIMQDPVLGPYHEWLHTYQQQQQNIVNMVNNYIAAQHGNNAQPPGGIFHVFSQEDGGIQMYHDVNGENEGMPHFIIMDVQASDEEA